MSFLKDNMMHRYAIGVFCLIWACSTTSAESFPAASPPEAKSFFQNLYLVDTDPVFDGTGNHLIWWGRTPGGQNLLRAEVGSLRQATYLLTEEEASRKLGFDFSPDGSHAGVLLSAGGKGKAHDLIIIDLVNGKRATTTIDLNGNIELIKIGNGGEVTIGTTLKSKKKNSLRLYKFHGEGGSSPLEKLDVPEIVNAIFDASANPVLLTRLDKARNLYVEAKIKEHWQRLVELPATELQAEPHSNYSAVDAKTDSIYTIMRLDGDTSRLIALSLLDGGIRTIAQDDDYDIVDMQFDPRSHAPVSYTTADPNPESSPVHFLNANDRARLKMLTTVMAPARIVKVYMNQRNDLWLLRLHSDKRPFFYAIYDRVKGGIVDRLDGTTRASVLSQNLADLSPSLLVSIPVRDGIKLDGFLMPPWREMPPRRRRSPAPMIVMIHGGPASHDEWKYDEIGQFLASRGYSILNVNYRGSSGRGGRFQAAAGRNWDGVPLDDIVDAVAWAADSGLADPGKIIVAGASFGGYLATAAAVKFPEEIRCAMSYAAPYDLLAIAEPRPSAIVRAILDFYLGDPNLQKDREKMQAMSPLFYKDVPMVPILIGFGAKDTIIPYESSLAYSERLQAARAKALIYEFPDQGHDIGYWPTKTAIASLMEGFFAKCLGNKPTAMRAESFSSSSLSILYDSGMLPELRQVLPKNKYIPLRSDASPPRIHRLADL
jgi:dipeptidyl aminopeptidase/acylaminoacyl peptidase